VKNTKEEILGENELIVTLARWKNRKFQDFILMQIPNNYTEENLQELWKHLQTKSSTKKKIITLKIGDLWHFYSSLLHPPPYVVH
jgi:hypothetical protein